MLYDLDVVDVIIDPGFGFAKDYEQNYRASKKFKIIPNF